MSDGSQIRFPAFLCVLSEIGSRAHRRRFGFRENNACSLDTDRGQSLPRAMSSPPPAPTVPALRDEDDGQRKPYGKRYPRVWTKDAHGGAYKISMGPGAKSGYDALEEKPDGTALIIEPGYEKPPTGATTNFVGNHMTQGAIDLAQDALTAPDPDREARLERLEQARGSSRKAPVKMQCLPSCGENDANAVALTPTGVKTPIETYTWSDTETEVIVTIKASTLSNPSTLLSKQTRMERAVLKLGAANDARFFSLEIPKGDSKNASYALTLRLHADVHATEHTLRHDTSTGQIQITLHKTAPGAFWPKLTTSEPLVFLGEVNKNVPKPPDLAALRREIIERREGALADRLPWRANPPLALPGAGDGEHPFGTQRSDQAGSGVVLAEDPTDAFVFGAECAERGAYAEAVERYSRGLATSPHDVKLLTARAKARRNLGAVHDAVDDFAAAKETLRGDDGEDAKKEFIDATTALGELRMECEQYAQAAIDFAEALALSPKSFPAQEGLRRARQLTRKATEVADLEKQRAAATALRGDVTGPRFVRPGMARFEDRGKSGKPF